jgi:hypothetical protein
MKSNFTRVVCLLSWALILSMTNYASAQTTANGPYYATPSWDQKLQCDTPAACPRFIVLLNWSREAVLDRETGLVWEQSPLTTTHTWSAARSQCTSRTVGGRKGWRLPSVHELASLVDPNNTGGNPDLPPGHPFTNVQSSVFLSTGYWSASTTADDPSSAWNVGFNIGNVNPVGKVSALLAWCVRGSMNADQY